MIDIIPSLLVQSEQEFLKQYRGLKKSVSQIQLDIADGVFVPNATWGNPEVIKKKVDMRVELHLMVKEPLNELKKWQSVEQVVRILVHYECMDNLKDIFPTLHAYGWDISIVLNPDTPIAALDPYLPEIKGVMFMGVYPGFQGQKFISETINRVRQFKEKKTNHVVELDGGVNMETLPDIVKSGVDVICPGSAIFGNERSPEENVKRMKTIIST
ncbi:MAG: hypothetical protein A3G08_01015 [Candidatus Magasanikbacteria bacterium RIFCSPLOWO2_12_FULL_47_9b]|nr:MAG: hypothetical protein A3I74_03050 [Candidatus Magasanikbacteria bacterium RIFCSPLOWO2_02_FULL_47_16]OGH79533.1 MAG: hypothetical protein A3C10_00355 [Candidatus Magasanikbacteria bacterium RIFCSPHIGHO2_02_FULL_48_18]OGH83397.1 MAG: hypothetical protein A3G08_01015 [Candidatus Magasanikbacteria bacterium RIFCSPLOWO2_12_FULL_47_9b]